MPRKGPIPKREVLPDPLYASRLVTKFVNRLMFDGKRVQPKRFSTAPLRPWLRRRAKNPCAPLKRPWTT